ncbi:MAG: c-type cytochrome biogenesis protein CcmI [Maritimibacter sp.]|nr:c-type cytochrome biogenesis protein CcmI [Maritimibacter sp.]
MALSAFWIISALLALAVTALLVLALLRGRALAADPAAAYDVQVYRDQLQEVERDVARGVLTEAEAERVRVEVSRRLLDADRTARAAEAEATAPRGLSIAAAVCTGVAVLAGAFGLYWTLGAPDYPDMPLAARINAAEELLAARRQAELEAAAANSMPEITPDARFAELMDRLRAAMEENPDDPQGLELLVTNEARLGNFAAAYAAKQRLNAVKGDDVTADDYADLADLMILAAGGIVSSEAGTAIDRALALDPANGAARYYDGLLHLQVHRYDLAFSTWDRLLTDSAPDDPWVAPVLAQMPQVAQLAGVRWTPPSAPPIVGPDSPGPSQGDIDAAADLTPEERDQMVRGMVDGLAQRLATDGGPPEDWARLIRALGVVQELDRAGAIWTEAQTVFADAPEALELIRTAAQLAGVAE